VRGDAKGGLKKPLVRGNVGPQGKKRGKAQKVSGWVKSGGRGREEKTIGEPQQHDMRVGVSQLTQG